MAERPGRTLHGGKAKGIWSDEALAAAFPRLLPSQRLAVVDQVVQAQAASKRRRRRLARAGRTRWAAWLIVLCAGLLCTAVGAWNYEMSQRMLADLDARAAGSTPAATAASPPWSLERWMLAADYILQQTSRGVPASSLPQNDSERLLRLGEHRQRYLAYETLGVALVALGGATMAWACVMLVARRE